MKVAKPIVTIKDIIKTLEYSLVLERKWARTCKADKTVAEAAKRFALVVAAVKNGDWSEYKADLLNWIKFAERGATAGYGMTRAEIRECESMKRYNEFRRVLGLRTRKS